MNNLKPLLFLFLFFFQLNILYSQKPFVIQCRNNLVKEGKAILYANPQFSSKTQNDTVAISNYTFTFKGLISFPEQHRIGILEPQHITEPFFISFGNQELTIDSSIESHDVSDFGLGIEMKGSETNDEYFNKYLTRFKELNKLREVYYSLLDQCDTISDVENHKDCIIKTEIMKVHLKLMRDSIFYQYAKQYPHSNLIFQLFEDALQYNGYSNLYQEAFEIIKNNTPDKINLYLDSFLLKKRATSEGSIFPLSEFINSKLSQNYLGSNKFTLVDFWFSKCRPCIAQFNLLKDVYIKNKERGFDVVAISIDKENAIEAYKKIISQNNYSWKQILDTGGLKTNTISINKFPSNFLLDQQGKIIAKDINPFVLEDYLDGKLVKNEEDAFRIKAYQQLFLNKPLKELLKQIKPPIKRVTGNPLKYNHERRGYFIFNFVDSTQYNRIRSKNLTPLTVVVYVDEFFDWDFQKRPKGRETIWTTDDEKRYENLTVVGFRVYGDASSND